jgi:2-polyprenyl-6-methoxyphenol hydroxylase-like FAD-dependent oxidoreductase
VRTLIIDRHPGTSPFPKATGVSTRTMEILRGWGLEDRVRAGATPAQAGIAVTTALTEPPLMVRAFGYPDEQAGRAVSPTTPVACPQDHLEPVLTAHLAEHGVRVQFNTEATSLAVDAERVTAWLRDTVTGAARVVHARYVVGADGPRSFVRAAAGIEVDELGAYRRVRRRDVPRGHRRRPSTAMGRLRDRVRRAVGAADPRWSRRPLVLRAPTGR